MDKIIPCWLLLVSQQHNEPNYYLLDFEKMEERLKTLLVLNQGRSWVGLLNIINIAKYFVDSNLKEKYDTFEDLLDSFNLLKGRRQKDGFPDNINIIRILTFAP